MNKYSNKLSSSTKRILSQTPQDEKQELTFLIGIDGELDEDRRSQLNSLVNEIRSVAGDVVALTASLGAVPKLTALEFVKYLDASGPMFLETPPSVPREQT